MDHGPACLLLLLPLLLFSIFNSLTNHPLLDLQTIMENLRNQKNPVKERNREENHPHDHHVVLSTPAPPRPPPPPLVASPSSRSGTHLSPPVEDSPLHSSDSSLSHLSSPREKAPSLQLSSVVVGGSQDPDERRVGGEPSSIGARPTRSGSSGLGKERREIGTRRGLLGCRVLGLLFCLISFSVLAADKNQGWALDSFHNYKEFRYCMTMNVIGFAYSGLQAYDLAYSLVAGKRMVENKHRYLIDFALDQMLAYLLLSASSSANFRVDDWESNWGKDKFPTMARASLAFSYLAFLAFASSSLLSGYNLLAHKSR